MAAYTLLIAHPPHGAVDARRVAPVLDLIPVEVTLKANYAVPEIWLAHTDSEHIRAAAAELAGAGVNGVIATSDQLLGVPAQELMRSFEFGADRFIAQSSGGVLELSYDAPVVVVLSTPRPPEEGVGAVGTTTVAGVQLSELSAFVDLYTPGPGGLRRISAFADLVDFAGLGAAKGPLKARNLIQLAQLLEQRLVNARSDRRLVNMQLRRKYKATSAALKETRRGLSFASRGLTELLEAIAPAPVELSQAEFSSRLVLLTRTLPGIAGTSPSSFTLRSSA